MPQKLDTLLEKALDGYALSVPEAGMLLEQKDPAVLESIRQCADRLRSQQVGERVSYVINRNINFSNICIQHCSFCAFRQDEGDRDAYWLDFGTILEKTEEAVGYGATEICMQGGLNPKVRAKVPSGRVLDYYLALVHAIRERFPPIHLHAFSPQESFFIAAEDNLPVEKVLQELRDAGVNSMPGTAAEVLYEPVRKRLCPEKINTEDWIHTVTTAHELGIPTTSTLLSGHIETPLERAIHLGVLRSIQERTGGFSEFVLLPYVALNAPKMLRNKVGRDQPALLDSLLTQAVARIFLGPLIANHQPSWVKLGLTGAAEALRWGCNDLGGTLMEEHITSSAGAQGGTRQSPEDLRQAILSAERIPYQRTTLYEDLEAQQGLRPLRDGEKKTAKGLIHLSN
jgi:5-amino-6-(D-ribitylamino)uracil---L-tyrosine 4-hydroxyphenyl transferase